MNIGALGSAFVRPLGPCNAGHEWTRNSPTAFLDTGRSRARAPSPALGRPVNKSTEPAGLAARTANLKGGLLSICFWEKNARPCSSFCTASSRVIFARVQVLFAPSIFSCCAMAIDSAAAFKELYHERGLGAHQARFEAAGWLTYSDLVFSTTFTPQNGEEERYNEDIIQVGLGDTKHRDRPKLRRLFYEAYTLVGADMRRKVDAPAGDAPRVVPNAEREARRTATAARVNGVKLLGELDISDRLLDRAIDMYDGNVLGYLGPELCTKRGNAMLGLQKDPLWESSPNANGGFTLRRADDGRRVDVDGQFAFSFAFQRRSLALEMGDIMSFDNAETLRNKFIDALMATPPVGFMAVGIDQVLEADRTFWIKMGELTRKGIKRQPDGRPCDKAFEKVIESFALGMALLPRQGSAPRVAAAPAAQPRPAQTPPTHAPQSGVGKKGQRRVLAKQDKEQAAADAIANAFKKPKTDGRPGSSKDRAGKPNTPRMPAKLLGMCSVSSKETGSNKFCYGYSLGECAAAAPGAACAKGLHACMKPLPNGEACSGAHTTFSCKR